MAAIEVHGWLAMVDTGHAKQPLDPLDPLRTDNADSCYVITSAVAMDLAAHTHTHTHTHTYTRETTNQAIILAHLRLVWWKLRPSLVVVLQL